MSAALSPGPWEAYQGEWLGVECILIGPVMAPTNERTRIIAIVSDTASMDDEDVANANLLRAAPDLFEVVRLILVAIQNPAVGMDMAEFIIKAARAFAKAGGGV